MNIEIFGRIRPSKRNEYEQNVSVHNREMLVTSSGASTYRFQELFDSTVSNHVLFENTFRPMSDLFLGGMNVSLLVCGGLRSGKTFALIGDDSHKSGILTDFLRYVTEKCRDGDASQKVKHSLTISVSFHMKDNQIYDLLNISDQYTQSLSVEDNPEKGCNVPQLTRVPISGATDTVSMVRQAMVGASLPMIDARSKSLTSAVLVQVELHKVHNDSPLYFKSRCSFVELCGVEAILKQSEGTSREPLLAVYRLISKVSRGEPQQREAATRTSALTKLLRDEIGGNCRTRCLVCIRPQYEPEVVPLVLEIAKSLSQIKNYPVINDSMTLGLLTQYRAEAMSGGSGRFKAVQAENEELRERVDRLQFKAKQLQEKLKEVLELKSELSVLVAQTEEEKLKINGDLVESNIRGHRLEEDIDSLKYDLQNKAFSLESQLRDLKQENDRLTKKNRSLDAKWKDAVEHRRKLTQEFIGMKDKFQELNKHYESELSRNEQLGVELINLVNAKGALLKENEKLLRSKNKWTDPEAEVKRVRDMVAALATGNAQEVAEAAAKVKETLIHDLEASQQKHASEVESLQHDFKEEALRLNERIKQMTTELEATRRLSRERQKKIAEQTAKLLRLENDANNLQSQNNRMQHKLKDVYAEYKARLVRYSEDIAEYLDSSKSVATTGTKREKMREFVDKMMQDIGKTHRAREEQLSGAAIEFKHELERIGQEYEKLLVAYRMLRMEAAAHGMADELRVMPDEYHFQLSKTDLLAENRKELNRLNSELVRTKAEVEDLRLRLKLSPEDHAKHRSSNETDSDKWTNLRRQVREFSLTTQLDLEKERAVLMSKVTLTQQELSDSQEYINTHLTRYKEEILRLKRLVGEST